MTKWAPFHYIFYSFFLLSYTLDPIGSNPKSHKSPTGTTRR